ncbi:hypothetical protein D3C76_982720 [compost metagenome]
MALPVVWASSSSCCWLSRRERRSSTQSRMNNSTRPVTMMAHQKRLIPELTCWAAIGCSAVRTAGISTGSGTGWACSAARTGTATGSAVMSWTWACNSVISRSLPLSCCCMDSRRACSSAMSRRSCARSASPWARLDSTCCWAWVSSSRLGPAAIGAAAGATGAAETSAMDRSSGSNSDWPTCRRLISPPGKASAFRAWMPSSACCWVMPLPALRRLAISQRLSPRTTW